MIGNQSRQMLIALSLAVFLFSSCQKFYTKEEAIAHLKTDESFIEYIKLRSDNHAQLQKNFNTIATPAVVKKYKRAKASGDQQYVESIRKQIINSTFKSRKEEAIMYGHLYKRYVKKLHIPRQEFTVILENAYHDYNKKMGRTRLSKITR
jgi:hypothetical protein